MVGMSTSQLPWHSTGQHSRQRVFTQSTKLQDVLYEIRGPIHDHAARLENERLAARLAELEAKVAAGSASHTSGDTGFSGTPGAGPGPV